MAAIGADGADVSVADALSLVWGYAVGVDLTRRDLQAASREKGQPWDAGKGFDASAPIGLIRPADRSAIPPAASSFPSMASFARTPSSPTCSGTSPR